MICRCKSGIIRQTKEKALYQGKSKKILQCIKCGKRYVLVGSQLVEI